MVFKISGGDYQLMLKSERSVSLMGILTVARVAAIRLRYM